MIEIREIDEEHKADLNLPNEPFPLFGRMEPSYSGGRWGHTEVLFDKKDVGEMRFPDEDYDYNEMKKNSVFLGAYDGEACSTSSRASASAGWTRRYTRERNRRASPTSCSIWTCDKRRKRWH